MNDSKPRVLFVDDEPNLLSAVRLTLRKVFQVDTAASGQEALGLLASNAPYAVIVSDMRMPHMDGAAFLAAAREVSPDATRILLTGETDLAAAIEAVNRGAIFRFLKKPCLPRDLMVSLESAVEQYRLVNAEKDILHNTLRSAVRLLTNILGHVHPEAFSRSARIHHVVEHCCKQLAIHDPWAFEIAGMVSHIGLVTIPSETVAKDCAGAPLETWERDLIERHTDIGSEMIEAIPRLEVVAEMIARSPNPATKGECEGSPLTWTPAVLGGELLRIATTFERLSVVHGDTAEALQTMRSESHRFPAALLDCLSGYELGLDGLTVASLMIDQLAPGMVTDDDVRSVAGGMLAAKGQIIDTTFIARLRNFQRGSGVRQPIRVLTPIKLLSSGKSA